MKLLGAEDGVLRGFGDAELDDALGGNLDGFPGLRVATHARSAVLQNELADARQGESVFGVLVSERGKMVEDFDSLLFGETVFVGKETGDLGFGECFCHITSLVLIVVVCLLSVKSHKTRDALKTFARMAQAKK
jgi:hypothetical protein